MLKHVVLMKLRADVTEQDIEEMSRGLAGLPARIPEIRGYHFGRDVRPERTYDFALVSDFDDSNALHRYQVHPDHVAVGALVRRLSETFAAVDFLY